MECKNEGKVQEHNKSHTKDKKSEVLSGVHPRNDALENDVDANGRRGADQKTRQDVEESRRQHYLTSSPSGNVNTCSQSHQALQYNTLPVCMRNVELVRYEIHVMFYCLYVTTTQGQDFLIQIIITSREGNVI